MTESQNQHAKSSLAIMQADIDKALQAKDNLGTEINTDINTDTESKGSADISEPAAKADINDLDESQLSRVIEMAWEDRTTFGAIEHSYGLDETAVIKLMRQQLKPSSFRLWRKRVTGRDTKHQAKRSFEVGRAYCKTQYKPR
ncbi:MAG: TIGR03643 family protein [Psychrobacter sp.]|nr:TIGR03643 family protein [Psychrobacter sp.]